MAHDVFISFSFSDKDKVDYIVNHLSSEHGISCWMCSNKVSGGEKYKAQITNAIDTAKAVVLIQSSNAVESKEIPKEIGMALESDKMVVPFRIDNSELKGDLKYDLTGVEYIDATIPTLDQRILDLARSISKAINKPLASDSKIIALNSPLKSSRITCSEIFDGRDKLLEDIHTAFEDRNVVFLHGMGGIGKSELARQYWKKNKDYYYTVVFAHYDKKLSSLIADDTVFRIDGVNRRTNKNNLQQTDEEYALDKLKIINKTSDDHTLIIIDNFDVSTKADDFFEKAISDINCRVLITTRHKPDRKLYHTIPVGDIDDKTLKKLFIQYANPEKTIIEEDDPHFEKLFSLTGRHIFTLELIAKYMEENDEIDYLSQVIETLKNQGFSNMDVDIFDNIRKLFRLTSLKNTEKYFLRCLAMMPPAGINQRAFKEWIDPDFAPRSRLVDLGLVKIDSGVLALHPMVREMIITELKPTYENCKSFIDKCAMIGSDAIPEMWGMPYEKKAMLFACYTNILNTVTDITPDTYSVYINMSYMYNYVGSYTEAIALHEKIYEYAVNHFGNDSKEAMLVYNHIAWKNNNCGFFDKALPYYEKAADWFYNHACYETRESHDVFIRCADVCYYIYEKNKNKSYLEKAFDYLNKASEYGAEMLKASESKSEHFQTHFKYQLGCTSRNYLRLYLAEQKYEMAEKCLENYLKVVTEFSKASTTPDADMAGYYRYMAMLKFETGEYDLAYEALKKSFDLYLNYFSAKTPRMIDVLENLALCCIKLKKREEANRYLYLAIEGATEIFTNNHPTFLRLADLKHQLEVKH